jgi:hypothetical protein
VKKPDVKPKVQLAATVLACLSVILFLFTFYDFTSPGRFFSVLAMVVYLLALHYMALWFLVSRRSGALRARIAVVNVSLLIVTVAVLSVGAEVFLRFMYRDVTTTADNLSYFSKQWLKTVRYNRWGFRERELDPVRPPRTYRIAVIGDSLAYGQGIAESERFSNLVEQRLNETGKGRYEVLNFALPGAETVDELAFLSRAVLLARPDFILLQWYTNDVQGPADKSQAPEPLTLIPAVLRKNSVLFYLIHRQLDSLQTRLGLVEDSGSYRVARFSDPNSPSSLAAADSMNLFIEITGKFNIPVGLVLFSESYFDPDTKLDFLLERMLQFCQARKLRCLDTRPILLPHQGDIKLMASRLDPHPSALANRLVADRLMETFRDVWLAR